MPKLRKIRIRIILEEGHGLGEEKTGRRLSRFISWPVIPRVGEVVRFGDAESRVTEVAHAMQDLKNPLVAVLIRWPPRSFKMLLEDPSWKEML